MTRNEFKELSFIPKGDQSALQIKVAQHLLGQKILNTDQFAAALEAQAASGSHLGHVMLGSGMVRALDYYRALAKVLGLPFVDLDLEPCDVSLIKKAERQDYIDYGFLPWRRDRLGVVILAATSITPRQHAWAAARYGRGQYRFVITSRFDIDWQVQFLFAKDDLNFACEALYDWKPEHSAKVTFTKTQVQVALAICAALLVTFFAAPVHTLQTAVLVVTLSYAATFLFKFLLTWIGASRDVDIRVSDAELRAFSDAQLPVYTVLVPMYREAKVLPLLVSALRKLDYPASKLDVKLVLEEDDHETITAAKALGLPATFHIVRVPASEPRTKPKACNYALTLARGEFVTIYDAEDQPEPDQLRKAVVAFRRSSPSLVCLQARLNYFNAEDNWLTRLFTIEYSHWFDFMLPALDLLRVPIPLGGTSNHFRTAELRRVGAWDPYNVTEDADLGIRFAQEGMTVGVLSSTTFEEANGIPKSWIKQRSRWIKGYMQTWLVHMRRPIDLWRTIGTRGFLSFHVFIGGVPLVTLLNPILWAMTILSLALPKSSLAWLFPGEIARIAEFNFVVGNFFLVYFGIIASLKRKYYNLVLFGFLQPFYWLMHSIAAYMALWQLITKPHYWEKTTHGTSAHTEEVLAGLAGGHAA